MIGKMIRTRLDTNRIDLGKMIGGVGGVGG